MYTELQREREDAMRQSETYAAVTGRIQKDREEVLELKATLQQELLTLREKVSQVNVGDKGVQNYNRDLRFKPTNRDLLPLTSASAEGRSRV